LFGFVSLLNDFASEMIYPLLPAFVTGVLGAGALVGLFAGAQAASARTFTEVLPGVDWPTALTCAGLLPVTGMLLGSVASLAGLRGLRG